MVITGLVGLLKFIIQKLWMVNTKSTVLASHANNLVYHVDSMFWDFLSGVLIWNNFAHSFETTACDVKQWLGRAAAKLRILFCL